MSEYSNLTVVVPPTAEPITIIEAFRQLRLDTDDIGNFPEYPLLLLYITSALEYAESYTGMALTDATYELRLDHFCDTMLLPVAPIGSIVSVTYVDAANAVQTVSPTVYQFVAHPTRPQLIRRYGQTWPTLAYEAAAVRIRFTGSPAQIQSPTMIKHAILFMVGHAYENREATAAGITASEVPLTAHSLLNQVRRNMGV